MNRTVIGKLVAGRLYVWHQLACIVREGVRTFEDMDFSTLEVLGFGSDLNTFQEMVILKDAATGQLYVCTQLLAAQCLRPLAPEPPVLATVAKTPVPAPMPVDPNQAKRERLFQAGWFRVNLNPLADREAETWKGPDGNFYSLNAAIAILDSAASKSPPGQITGQTL